MLRLTLAQMRRSVGRLLAAALAIVVGTAFIAATLLASALLRETTYDAMTASLGDADVVVSATDGALKADDLAAVRGASGVSAADGTLSMTAQILSDGIADFAFVDAAPSTPELTVHEVAEGELPTTTGQIALTAASAGRLGVDIGDDVEVEGGLYLPAGGASDEPVAVDSRLEVVGILEDPGALFGSASSTLVAGEQLEAWVTDGGREMSYEQILAVGDGSEDDVAAAVAAALDGAGVVRTGTEVAEELTSGALGSTVIFTALILGFGALAMLVASIVITNTFQVLVAQRTRQLALLRCVGATKAQIRRSVLTEAVLLGTLAGIAGLAIGAGLAQGTLWVLGTMDLDVPVPSTITLTAAAVLVPVLTGAAVTVLAALAPARAATRVAPLAAMRPAGAPDVRGTGRGRLVLSLVLIVGGGLLLAGATAAMLSGQFDGDDVLLIALAAGVLGGGLSFAGVMVGAVFVVPAVVRALGSVATRLGGGSTTRLATANATRNPRRTSATATALIIGVTLVSMMSTGAVSARASLDAQLDGAFPADIVVTSAGWAEDGGAAPLTPNQLTAVAEAPGVERVLEVRSAPLNFAAGDIEVEVSDVTDLDPAAAGEVLRDLTGLEDLAPGTVVLAGWAAEDLEVEVGDTVEAALAPDAATDQDAPRVPLVVVSTDSPVGTAVLPETLEQFAPDASTTGIYARLDAEDAAQASTTISDRLSEATGTNGSVPYVSGEAAERQMFGQVIDTLLAIVVGLLAAAVVIALIGVANTLSLSVIERTRESALLRAMGLTRRQLRGMLATEGVLLAVVGVLVGVVLGVLYGWAGTAVILGAAGGVTLAVPWLHLGVVVVVAVLAGLLASVLPARTAVRTPPVAALAAE
ncbi:ABC transporter permease [Georgenia faecalis]|uniref:ABC transporter permease n=1 Tax=Georgenia faecalis TaxID=2483799 RepID=A0ABV9D6K2_9MICO|nr:ABC transporter permease [Georgenia faecalis]